MWDFDFSRAVGLMVRTFPYLIFRVIVYGGIAVAYVVVTGFGAGIGYGLGWFGGPDSQAGFAFWGGLIGFGLTATAIYLLREYLLYTVKAGHIAVLVELMDDRELPDGQGQVAYGASVVKERFVQSSALFGLDQLVKGVIRAISGVVEGVASILPIPGLNGLVSLFRAFMKVAVGFVDEVILAHAIRTLSDNAWASAREALVLYGQNYQAMLKNAAFIALFTYIIAILVFLFMLAPAAGLVYLMPGSWSAGGLVFAIIFAWAVKAAVLEPLAITLMMQVFFKVTEGQTPNPEWDAKLSQMSDKFVEIKDKAFEGTRPGGAAAPAE
ncbi:hypothetical protein [uncultured Roseibium sp.]|uniref:hypothetical protein n=1 Tax=uncultured Roseibium sp. TaxID=1936171 RepID=UPI00261955FA|nr:hypothetical protein [uncultured Roseibium sp.]